MFLAALLSLCASKALSRSEPGRRSNVSEIRSTTTNSA